MCSAQAVYSAWVLQCQSVGGLIAVEHGPKSELYSRKASVIDFLRWNERPLIVLLEHPFCLDRGVLKERDGLSIGKQSFLIVLVPMMFLGADPPRISILSEIYLVGRKREASSVHDLHKLRQL